MNVAFLLGGSRPSISQGWKHLMNDFCRIRQHAGGFVVEEHDLFAVRTSHPNDHVVSGGWPLSLLSTCR